MNAICSRFGIILAALTGLAALIGGCAAPASGPPLPFYRCEYGIEFTAKFIGDSVALDSSRGYDVLYRDYKGKPTQGINAANDYGNPRMSAEFLLGPTQREALVRYSLLPLVARCVRD